MIDGKMVGILQGDTGSSKCHYCTSSIVDMNIMNNVVRIMQGFVINELYYLMTTFVVESMSVTIF